MTQQSILTALVVPLLMGGLVAADEGETIVLRGETFHVWPTENLRARGLDIQEIPRERNAAWGYIDAVNAYAEMPGELTEAFDYAMRTAWPAGQTALADYLKHPDNRRAVELVRTAVAMDRCQMPYFGDPSDSIIGVLLPNLSHFRFLSKMLVVDARRLEAEGNCPEAIKNLLAVMSMGEHIGQGHTLIEGLVGIAVWAVADRALVDMILRRPLSLSQLRMLQKELDRRAPRLPTAERGLHGERQFGPAIVDELISRPLRFFTNLGAVIGATGDDLDGFFMPVDPITIPEDGWGRLEVRIGKLIFPDRAIKRHMLGYYDRIDDRIATGMYQDAWEDFDDEKYIRENIPAWDVVSRVMLPSLSAVSRLGERSKVSLAATRAIIAIRTHTLKNENEPPSSLHELAEKLPTNAVVDPFSGDLLVYRRTAEGWVLYSVGPNFVDDGGREGDRWLDLDIVYQCPPDPIEPFQGRQVEDGLETSAG